MIGRIAFAATAFAFLAADTGGAAAADTEKTAKSIVPSKYGAKYRNGGSDELADFIKAQCTGKDGFEYTAFFELVRKNGIDEAKVAHYEQLVVDKVHGAAGRARMTLRNMLASKARKDGKLVGLDGTDTELNLPKPAASGAAKAAQEASAGAGDAGAAEDNAD